MIGETAISRPRGMKLDFNQCKECCNSEYFKSLGVYLYRILLMHFVNKLRSFYVILYLKFNFSLFTFFLEDRATF